jgi:heme-degrading monooxygenase HmoA
MIVVLFKSRLRDDANVSDYEALGGRMYEIVSGMRGFIDLESYSTADGELVVVRFESDEALQAWRNHPDHQDAQRLGREVFYEWYHIQVCSLDREYQYSVRDGST